MADGEPAGLDGVRVVRLPGCVDVGNAMDVRAALAGELRDGVRVLVADLAATASLALEGLQVLVLVRAAAARRGAELRLASARPAVARYLELTGTARMFPLYDSVDRARAAGRPAGSRLRPVGPARAPGSSAKGSSSAAARQPAESLDVRFPCGVPASGAIAGCAGYCGAGAGDGAGFLA